VKSEKAEVKSEKAEGKSEKAEGRRQKAEGKSEKIIVNLENLLYHLPLTLLHLQKKTPVSRLTTQISLLPLHVQIRLPVILNRADQVLEKSNMNRAVGFRFKLHRGFSGCSISLFHVTDIAGRHQVFPAVCTIPAPGHHMIKSQVRPASAVLACMIIPLHNIPAR